MYTNIEFLLKQVVSGKYTLMHVCHSGTERNPLFQVPHFSFSGLSLPDMSYYTERTELKEPLLDLVHKQKYWIFLIVLMSYSVFGK